ncbi:MAG: hypothetical protein M1829_005640 [Trizodia sp. TS-e1964]|nr:MAG: hypothetical protein M1829_005640 [Trizodia sp. TS-e1964]
MEPASDSNHSARAPLPRPKAQQTRANSSSSHATPQSSLSSQRHRRDPSPPQSITPTSELLKEALREKKAQSHRINKTYKNDARRRSGRDSLLPSDYLDQERQVQSSPIASNSRLNDGVPRKAPASRGMGLRETDEYVSTLHKQNFDLKMELFHRRQRVAVLEERLEQTLALESQNEELQEMNETLVEELAKRDRAVEEAVAIICQLEERLERMEERMINTRPSTAQPDTEYFTTDAEETIPPSSPPETQRPKTPTRSRPGISSNVSSRLIDLATPQRPAAKTTARAPSFLTSDKAGSAGALRSLYLAGENESVFSLKSLSRQASKISHEGAAWGVEEDDNRLAGLESPSLSILSESSFLSVYGERRRQERDRSALSHINEVATPSQGPNPRPSTEAENQGENTAKASRVEKWMDDRTIPNKTIRTSPGRIRRRDGQFVSINDVLHHQTPLAQEDSQIRGSPRREMAAFVARQEDHRTGRKNITAPSGSLFGQELLPPTPDTMSTIDREAFEASTSKGSIIAEKSLLDGTPGPASAFSSLRPRTSNGVQRPYATGPFRGWDTDVDLSEIASSDGGIESIHVEQSDHDHIADLGTHRSRLPMFTTALPPSAMKQIGTPDETPNKSSLFGYSGDMMFNGDGIAAFSSNPKRMSLQYSPSTEHRRTQSNRTDLTSLLPMDWGSGSSETATPTKLSTPSPGYSQTTSNTTIPDFPQTGPGAAEAYCSNADFGSKNVQQPPLRLTVPTLLHTTPLTKRGSLTSRIFGRSASTTAGSSSDFTGSANDQENSEQKDPVPFIIGKGRTSNFARSIGSGNLVFVPSSNVGDTRRPGTADSVDVRKGAMGQILQFRNEGPRVRSRPTKPIADFDASNTVNGVAPERSESRATVSTASSGRRWGFGMGRSASLRVGASFSKGPAFLRRDKDKEKDKEAEANLGDASI